MNEKERIIELVKQNIISMEEALDLLEAVSASEAVESQHTQRQADQESTEKTEESISDTTESSEMNDFNKSIEEIIQEGKNIAKNLGDYLSQKAEQKDPSSSHGVTTDDNVEDKEAALRKAKLIQIDAELRNLYEESDRRHEALTICKQRLREIEIFEELDDLTEEMASRKIFLEEKKTKIENKMVEIQEKIDALMSEKESLGFHHSQSKSDIKDLFGSNADKITEVASQLGREAKRESQKWGSIFNEKAKTFMENFKLKNVDISIQVPWIKTTTEEFDWTFDDEGITDLVVESYNGSVELESYDGEDIVVHADARFHGNHEVISEEVFLSSNTIEVIENQLIVQLKSAKISADLLIKLPNKLYQRMSFNLMNGDIDMANIEAGNIQLESKNGDAYFKKVTAKEVTVDFLNGDIEFVESPLDTIVINNMNGDIRINGYINNLSAETLNSDFYLTKRNLSDTNIKIKTISGDIKLSLPEQLNLMVEGKATTGEIKYRVADLEVIDANESKNKGRFHRIVSEQTQQANVNMTTQSGDIYLKDSHNKV